MGVAEKGARRIALRPGQDAPQHQRRAARHLVDLGGHAIGQQEVAGERGALGHAHRLRCDARLLHEAREVADRVVTITVDHGEDLIELRHRLPVHPASFVLPGGAHRQTGSIAVVRHSLTNGRAATDARDNRTISPEFQQTLTPSWQAQTG